MIIKKKKFQFQRAGLFVETFIKYDAYPEF